MDDEQKINALIRFTGDASDRLELIAGFADALADRLPGDSWHLAHAIREVALGHMTIDEAVASVSED